MIRASENKYLKVKPGVVLTPIIEPVIVGLDVFFTHAKKLTWVTSGKRNGTDQLEIIRAYALDNGIDKEYPSILTATLSGCFDFAQHDGSLVRVYEWQPAWSALLNRGVIINPPLKAECLFDYWSGEINKKGMAINPSEHFDGSCFDIGGASGSPGIDDELVIVQEAYKQKVIPGWVSYKIERKNNAIHCKCRLV